MPTQILIPERWLVQPAVVPMHVLREPERKQTPSLIAQRMAKNISTYAALPNCERYRMLAVSMQSPDDLGLRILRHILAAGDRRYWSWSATKRDTHGKVRTSLMWEVGASSGNLSKSLGPLLEDGVLAITEKDNGTELIAFTTMGKMLFAELRWRWFLREAATSFLQPLADNYGWQEVSIQIDRYVAVEQVDPSRKADVIKAAHDQLKDGVEAGGPVLIPSSWAARKRR